jgi:hypothetical protein
MLLATSAAVNAQGLMSREILGVRLGGTVSSNGLHTAFGNGTEIELHFIKGIIPWFGVDVSLSSHSFGASKNSEKNIELTGLDREVDLHMYSIDVGAIAAKSIRQRMMLTIEGGPGLYSVNTILTEGFFEAQRTDNRFGLYGGVGWFYRLGGSFLLNANVKYHHVFVGSSQDDTIHFYTGETSAEFYQITVGIAIHTG